MISLPTTFILIGIAIIAGAVFSWAVHRKTWHKKPKVKGQTQAYYTVGEWVKVNFRKNIREKQASLSLPSPHDPDKPDERGNAPLPDRK